MRRERQCRLRCQIAGRDETLRETQLMRRTMPGAARASASAATRLRSCTTLLLLLRRTRLTTTTTWTATDHLSFQSAGAPSAHRKLADTTSAPRRLPDRPMAPPPPIVMPADPSPTSPASTLPSATTAPHLQTQLTGALAGAIFVWYFFIWAVSLLGLQTASVSAFA